MPMKTVGRCSIHRTLNVLFFQLVLLTFSLTNWNLTIHVKNNIHIQEKIALKKNYNYEFLFFNLLIIAVIPIVTKEIKPLNKHINPIGIRKKFSCSIPCASIYPTDSPFTRSSIIPIKIKKLPIIEHTILYLALLVSLPSLITFSVMLFISFSPLIK